MKIIAIHPAGSHHAPSIKHSCGEPEQENDDPNNYKLRHKAPCFSSGDTPHLPWMEVQCAKPDIGKSAYSGMR